MRSHARRWTFSFGVALAALVTFAPAAVGAQQRGFPARQAPPPAAPPAAGPKRILVERFSGPQAGGVRAGLLSDLADHADTLTLVAEGELRTAGQRAGITRVRSEADYAAVAQQLNVAAFVDGRVARRGRSWALTVRVRSGMDGSILGTETWSGGTMNALGAVRRNGHSRLAQYFDAAREPRPPAPPEPPERPWYQQEAVEPAEPPAVEEDAAPEGDDRYPAFRVGVGGGTLGRSMSAEVTPIYGVSGSETEGPPELRSYESAGLGHMELGFDGELFPGAFGGQPFPYIGLAFSYRASVGLESTGCAASTPTLSCPSDVVVQSSQSDLYIGARGRYAIGGPARGAELTFDLGYGYFGFSLDLDALKRLDPSSVIPPVGYSYMNLGVGISVPAVSTYLVLSARFAYRLSLGVSMEQKQVWGTQTSSAPGYLLGFEVKSGMPYIARGLYLAAAFQYFSFSTTYEGETACASEPCTPWSAAVAGAPWQPIRIADPVGDAYLRLAFSVGYEFR